MGSRIRKGLVILAALAVGVLLAVLLAVHTPMARGRALAWASSFLTRYHLDLAAGNLSYNLLTRRITLTDVRLAAEGFAGQPFLVASRIEVQLPWSVFRRRFAIDHLTIDQGIVDIVRDENNIVNLPPSSTAPTPERARELDIRSLTLNGLDVQYEDRFRNWGVKIPRIHSALLNTALGAKGNFGVRGPLTVRLRDRVMTMAPFETVMTFDGSNVSLEQARLASPELEVFLNGPIHRVLDAPALDLAIKGSVNLDEAIAWVPPPPVPVAGQATIEGSISGPVRNFSLDLAVHSNTLDVGRERDLGLTGPVRVTFDGFSGEDLVISPQSGGSVRARFNVPWGKATVSTAAAEWSGIDAQAALRMAAVNPQPIGGAFEGHGEFEFGAPRKFVIANRSSGRSARGIVPMTGTINATIVGDDYRFDHRNSFPGFDFEGRMSGRIHRGDALLSTMTGPAHARVSDVGQAAASARTLGFSIADIILETHGAVDAPLTLAGSYRYPEIETTVTGDAVEIPLLGRVGAKADVVANTKVATISGIDIRRGTAAITGNVVANVANRAWSGQLHVEAPDVAELQDNVPEAWRVAGPMSADATLGGTFDAIRLDTTINGTALTWSGQSIDRVAAKAIVTTDAIDVTSFELHQGPGFADGHLRYAWDTGAYTASLKGDRLSWQGTVLSPNDTQALFSLQFDGDGTVAQPKGQARIDFNLTGGKAGTFIGSGDATVDLLGPQARIVAKLPAIGAIVNADIATATPYDYKVSAQLDRFELARMAPFMGAIEAEILGFANGTITASGRLADDRDRVAFVNITELDAGIAGVPVSLNSPLNATLRGDDLVLKDLFVRVGSGRLSASGEWNTRLDGKFRAQFLGDFQDVVRLGKAFGVPMTFDGSGPMMFDVQSNGTRAGTVATVSVKNGTFNWGSGPAAVQELVIDAALNGTELTVSRITGNVASGGVIGAFSAKGAATVPELTLSAITGELVLDAAQFTFSGIPVEQQRPSRFQFANGNLVIADVSWLVADNALLFGGSVGIAADDPPLDLSLKGLIDLRVLSAVTSTIAFAGAANVDTRIAGTVAAPRFDGRIVLDDAEIAISEPRVVLSELAGPIVLNGQVLRFDGIRGLANGGALSLDGSLEFEGQALSGGSVDIQAQGVALELPKGLRSELDALVTFRPDPKNPSLIGDIRIVQSAYTETITIAALARQAALPVGAGPAVDRPYLDRLQLNLAVTTTDDIVVDNNYGRLSAEGNVRVVGTVAQPGLDGRITLREGGQIYLAGRTFKIIRGDISFSDRRHIHPEFNIAAEANIGAGSNITMTLTGTLERPTIDLTSEDGSMTPSEIAAGIVGSSNSEAALALLSADLLGVTGRAIGLDAFRVERGDYTDTDFREDPSLIANDGTDPTTRLTVGKRLSEQVEVTVSQNLRENGKATFVVSYFPRRNVELRALSRDSGTVSLGVRHQVTFGGGQTKAPSERRVPPKVSAITFSGVDPAIAAEAGSQVKLDVGDDFDFLELQKDIDRILENFHQQGYLEARVRTRRVEADDARSVAVEFVIERGPRTTLQVEGVTLPAKVITELEEAWHKNVFDQFLIDDLTHRVRRELVTSGDLGSVVVGRVDRPEPGTKRFRIDVTPGAPVTGREIRFVGNAELDQERLAAEVTEAGLDIEAWLDRTLVERALKQVYNEEGFLKAEVVARPLTIDGTTGVLLVEIKEGPRARITDVKWAGVDAARLPAVEKAAAIATPAPYISLNVNDATRRIEDEYRRNGFNSAEVAVDRAVAPDDTVALTFRIVEGTQQVLQSVELTGNEITNGKVLTQALRFELGKPVDLDEWTLARKRLYDTNVFRLVEIQPMPVGEAVNGVQPVKAVVNVEEYPAWNLRYGFQLEGERQAELDEFTNTRNAGVVADLRNPNLFGRALTGGLFGMYERDRRDVTLFLATSRLFGWRARTSLYGYYQRDRRRDVDGAEVLSITDQQGVSMDQRWRVRGFQLVYGYRFERNHTFDPDPGNDPLPFDIVANIAKLSEAIIFDRRDDPINSRKGTFSSVSFDQSAPFLGSDVANRKLLLQQFVFVPLGRVVLASRAQLGFAYGRDPLQFDDRFRAGGATSVRGYSEESLGRCDPGRSLACGDRLIVLNQEARFPIYRWANGVVFVDAGNIFAEGETGGLGALKLGYGFGLRFDTPVGLLRGDVGFPRDPLSTSRSTAKWYFGFGHIF